MCPIFDGSVLTDFEKYEKITWLALIWTYRTIQFWVPIFKLFNLNYYIPQDPRKDICLRITLVTIKLDVHITPAVTHS